MRIYVGLFVIVFLVALGRVEPAVAQECDPDVCAGWPAIDGNTNVKTRHKNKHVTMKKRSAAPKVKHQSRQY